MSMRYAIVCMSLSALALGVTSGCERAETPTPAEETPPAESAAVPMGPAATLTASLSGPAEVPTPGDPDGTGTAQVRIDAAKGEVCYELTVENIQAASAAHIHAGAAGVAGGVAVPLDAPAQGSAKNCATVEPKVAQDIVENAANYYVNVHNAEFPQGAVRGQLQP
jgi:hypothetical protein